MVEQRNVTVLSQCKYRLTLIKGYDMNQFDKGDHVFVHIDNALVYKTVILDSRTLSRNNTIKLEYLITNTSQDSPSQKWVLAEKCIHIRDIDRLLRLDSI